MKMSEYRYAPHSEETKELCKRLEEALPDVKFKFRVERDGKIRMRAFRNKPHKDKELLLREQTPDQVVEAFVTFFEPATTPAN